MADISSATREQSAGIEQVGLAVTQMDEMTQQNAALVEQAAAAAESLEEQARNLAQSVSVFKLAGGLVVHEQAQKKAAPKQLTATVAKKTPSAPQLALAAPDEDEWAEF